MGEGSLHCNPLKLGQTEICVLFCVTQLFPQFSNCHHDRDTVCLLLETTQISHQCVVIDQLQGSLWFFAWVE